MLSGIGSMRWPGIVPGRLTSTTGDVSLAADRSVSGTLTLTTKDGDSFTLSAERDASFAYTRSGGAWSASTSAHQSLSFTATGDFDAGEIRDITHAVRRFLHELRAEFRGTGGGPVAEAVGGDPTSEFHTACAREGD